MREFIFLLKDTEIHDLTPSRKQHETVESIYRKMTDLDSVTKVVHCEATNLSEVCTLFDLVVEQFSGTKSMLQSNTSIAGFPSF